MRTGSFVAAALLLSSVAQAQNGTPGVELDVGEPVQVQNLAVMPLYTKRAPPYDDYVVLEEAQANRSVRIAETRNGEVDHLLVKNKDQSKRPLYLLGGEVVLGGRQDRMVVNDTVVDAGAAKSLEVRCVEPGRWSGADLTFRSSEAVAHPDLRKAALFKDQEKVWDEVARKSKASNVESSTGTYRRVLQDEGVRRRIKGYLDELQAKIPRSEKLTGLAVAINGSLELVDLFDSPLLYRKLERKLLASYVLAALERQPESADKAKVYQAKARALGKSHVDELMQKSDSESVAMDSESQEASRSASSRVQAKAGPTGKVYLLKGKAVHKTIFGQGPDEQK